MADRRQSTSDPLALDEREDINRIAAAHGAQNVRVFGSVRRGEANGSSDLDLLVDMSEGRSLFDSAPSPDEDFAPDVEAGREAIGPPSSAWPS